MDLIAKKYRVLKALGQGAMGEVFLVLPPRGDPVALKLLKNEDSKIQKAALEQFENEFKVLKKLSHPHIGRIHDYGFDEELQKVYFTSPWLKGTDLFVATKDLPYAQCEEYFVQLLRALNYLHQKEIIHCDLKPGNVFVEDGKVSLIDFGLAGYWGESIVGTPTYLAPEVFKGERHSVASDLYAAGIIFYNCLARIQPFSGKNLQEIYDRHRTHMPLPLSEINPHVPQYFSDIALTLLSKKAKERYPSAAAVIEEIATYSKKNYAVETQETLLSYLPSTSELIGRPEAQWKLENQISLFLSEDHKKPYFGLFLHGDAGVGKSKFVSQLRTRLQLEKIAIEDAVLPFTESDRRVLNNAKVIILRNVQDYLLPANTEGQKHFQEFLSFLEQKILSPQTTQLLLVVTGLKAQDWLPFENLFPPEEFVFESVPLAPFTEDEMRLFLERVIGQKEVPSAFVQEIFRNTGGNPALCQQIIESLIQQGLLFDGSGRWSPDLLPHLSEALKKVEPPRSLEEQLKKDYESLNPEEKEIVLWLALAPYGLTEKILDRLTSIRKISRVLKDLSERNIIRAENEKAYNLYRSTFRQFLLKTLPKDEQQKRHDQLAQKAIGLAEIDRWYHMSHGTDLAMAREALEKRGEALFQLGQREEALSCFEQLIYKFQVTPQEKMAWVISASEILIWQDRFKEGEELITDLEEELTSAKSQPDLKDWLALKEKKGLAIMQQHQFDQALIYFNEGLKISSENPGSEVEYVRFLNDLAENAMFRGEQEKAIELFLRSREQARRLSKSEKQKITNNDLGTVYFNQGKFDQAIEILSEDIKMVSSLSNREPLARFIYALAECYRKLGKFRRAVKEYQQCIEICQEDNFLPLLLRAYNSLGTIFYQEKKYNDALANYQRAIDLSVHLKDPMAKATMLVNQALIYRGQGNWTQSSRRYLLAKQILEARDSRLAYESQLLSHCYNELTALALNQKDTLKALTFQMERLHIVEQSDALKQEAFGVTYNMAELYLENRLGEQFQEFIQKLEGVTKTPDQNQKVQELKDRWAKINSFEQESTMRVKLEPQPDMA